MQITYFVFTFSTNMYLWKILLLLNPGKRKKLTHTLCVCVCVCYYLSRVWFFATPLTVCSLPGSSVHGVLQARILELAAIPFSRGASWPRDRTYISWSPALQADSLPLELSGKPNSNFTGWLNIHICHAKRCWKMKYLSYKNFKG